MRQRSSEQRPRKLGYRRRVDEVLAIVTVLFHFVLLWGEERILRCWAHSPWLLLTLDEPEPDTTT